MAPWLEPFLRGDNVSWRTAVFSLLLAFGLTQVLAGVYIWSFRGLSYTRSFVHTLALAGIVVCTVMLAIGNSLAAGIGVAGGLSIVRFRITLRDPRDILYVFASLAAGIASGLQAWAAATLGTVLFCAAAAALNVTSFGARQEYDGLIRFFAPATPAAEEAVARTLRMHCPSFVLVTLRGAAQGQTMEHAYQIRLPELSARHTLVAALQRIDGVTDVALLLQEPTLEL